VYSPAADVVYDWGDGRYASATALLAATGQGAHDLNADPQATGTVAPPEGSPLIDSCNDEAPGVPTTDFFDTPRDVDDPLVTDPGTGHVDRGAVERQDPITTSITRSTLTAPTGGTITATVDASSPWAPVTRYRVDFGDGTPAVVSTTPAIQHAYAAIGSYTMTASATDGLGATSQPSTAAINIVTPEPLVGRLSVWTSGALGIAVSSDVSGSWTFPEGVTYDFGDGSAPTTVWFDDIIDHHYAAPGTYSVTATTTDAGGHTWSTTHSFTTAGARFVPHGPQRVLDTRHGTGTGVVARIGDGGTVRLKIAGTGTIPAGATAVALNVTVTDTSAAGYVSVYPDDVPRPGVSTVNFVAGQTVANSTIVALSPGGYVDLYNHSGPVDLVADVTGYFAQGAAASGYTTVAPQRLLDTRSGAGAVATGGTVRLPVSGTDEVPTGVTAVALNVTAVDPAGASGYLTAYPDGGTRPTASSLNYVRGGTVANMAIVPVGQDGEVDFYNGSTGSTDLLVDVVGYFTAAQGSAFAAVTPYRTFDTRTTAPVRARTTVTESTTPPTGTNLVNNPSTKAVVFNMTVTDTTTPGYLTVFNSVRPATSNLNWTAGRTVPNMAIPDSREGVEVYNGGSSDIDVLGDVVGYFGD
jgi:hypothetical protein